MPSAAPASCSSVRAAAFAAALLAALAVARPARAQSDEVCPPAALRWVAAAAADLATPLSAVRCHPGMAIVRAAPPIAGPLDIEVAEPPGPALRRAGRLRVTPLAEIDDYAHLAPAHRASFEALVAWLAAHAADVTLAAPAADPGTTPAAAPLPRGTRAPWLALAAALLALAALYTPRTRTRPRPTGATRVDAMIAFTLGGVSLALRAWLGVAGPYHINGQGPFWIRAARSDAVPLEYGPGYREVFGWLARAAGAAPDRAIFAANGVLSALAPPLAYALARLLGLTPARAALAGAVLACDPIAIRFSTTESYFNPLVALTLGAAVALAAAAHHAHDRAWLRSGALALAAGMLTAQAARIHPVGWPALALAPLVVFATAAPRASRARRAALTAGALATVALVVGVTSGGVLLGVLRRAAAHGVVQGGLAGRYNVFVEAASVFAMALVASLFWPAPRSVALLAAASVSVWVALAPVYAQSAEWQAAFGRLYLALPAVALAALVPARVAAHRAAPAALAALAVVVLAASRGLLARRTTEQLEYAWLRGVLAALPPGCRVAAVHHAGARVLELPGYVVRAAGHAPRVEFDVASADDVAAARATAPCVVYVHGSLCTSREGRARCDAIEAQGALVEVSSVRLPARPSFDALPYDRGEVTVVVMRPAAGP